GRTRMCEGPAHRAGHDLCHGTVKRRADRPRRPRSRAEVDNPVLLDFLRERARSAEIVASVCTGAFLLERAGLLSGKRATTHWASIDRLRALGTVEVVDDQRWVDEGQVVTSAGVSAGIDVSLYLVARLWGNAIAAEVQK